MRPSITIELHPNNDLYHLSTLLTGLTSLHQSGEIRLEISVRPSTNSIWGVYRVLARLAQDGPAVRCTVDLADRSDFWDSDGLEQTDLYFKRSYWSTRPAPSKGRRAAVHGFGLNYACRSPRFPYSVAAKMAWAVTRHAVLRLRSAQYVRRSAKFLRSYLENPSAAMFEVPAGVHREMKVLFQTRLWSPEEGPDIERLNDERLSLVRALRRAFGDRFLGGVVRTPVAERLCPDAISPHPSGHREYAVWSRDASIGVYTRGLHDSIAFKLPEYLANGKAIVAEGIPAAIVLPTPLTDGREYLSFANTDACLATCDRLLSQPAETRALGERAHAYYESHCSPTATARRLLHTLAAV
jgi:hypothetical protein